MSPEEWEIARLKRQVARLRALDEANTDLISDLGAQLLEKGAEVEAVVRAAESLEFSAYPAHGSGFVMQVTGDVDTLRKALAAYRGWA